MSAVKSHGDAYFQSYAVLERAYADYVEWAWIEVRVVRRKSGASKRLRRRVMTEFPVLWAKAELANDRPPMLV